MTQMQRHYETLLAPIYVWMAGGLESALVAGTADVAPLVPGHGLALDLGAGFGMHAIPLARGGYDVVAIDSSALLLEVLRANGAGLPIHAVEADLLNFARYVDVPPRLVVCLGDTLTHLESTSQVERLCRDVAACLDPEGRFVLTFRDYSHPATGDARFIPVRSDADRIHTCFIEALPEHVRVHDIVHEREGGAWRMQVSSYPKLRLSPQALGQALRDAGLEPEISAGARGMVTVTATRR